MTKCAEEAVLESLAHIDIDQENRNVDYRTTMAWRISQLEDLVQRMEIRSRHDELRDAFIRKHHDMLTTGPSLEFLVHVRHEKARCSKKQGRA